MKPKILKLSTVVLLLLFIGASCQKDEIEYADEGIVVRNEPSISIYKTKGNYKDNLAVGLDSNGNVSSVPLFGYDTTIVYKNKNGRFTLKNRYFLRSGYVIEDIYLDYAFTDISISEMVNTVIKSGAEYWTTERYSSRIIDKDPFAEFYFLDGTDKPERNFTLGEINDMIESGTLETTFEKLK